MTKIENWSKGVHRFDDSRYVYMWENSMTGERLLLRSSNQDENYVLVRFGPFEDITWLEGEKMGFATTQREGKSIATEYMEKNVR